MGASAVEDAAAGRVSTVLTSGFRLSLFGFRTDFRPQTETSDLSPCTSDHRLPAFASQGRALTTDLGLPCQRTFHVPNRTAEIVSGRHDLLADLMQESESPKPGAQSLKPVPRAKV